MLLKTLVRKYNQFNPGSELPEDFDLSMFTTALCQANPKMVLHPIDTAYLRPSIVLSLMTIPTHLRLNNYSIATLSAEVLAVTNLINCHTGSVGDDTQDVAYILNFLYSSAHDRLSLSLMKVLQSVASANGDNYKKTLLIQTCCWLSLAIDGFESSRNQFRRLNSTLPTH